VLRVGFEVWWTRSWLWQAEFGADSRSQSRVVVLCDKKRIVKLEASQAFLTATRENPANKPTINSQCCSVLESPRGQQQAYDPKVRTCAGSFWASHTVTLAFVARARMFWKSQNGVARHVLGCSRTSWQTHLANVLFGGGQLRAWEPETWILIECDRCCEPASRSSMTRCLRYLILLQSWISLRLSSMLNRRAQIDTHCGQQIAWKPET
jgi:hypothetical protein